MSNNEVFYFCKDNIGNVVKVLYDIDSAVTGRILSVDRFKGVVISKEENFYIVGDDSQKYSSKFIIDPSLIKDISLILDKQ